MRGGMTQLRIIFQVNGLLLLILAAAMLIPAAIDWLQQNPDWQSFLGSSFITAFTGGTFFLTSRAGIETLSIRQAFLLTVSCWFILPLFGCLPLLFSELNLSFVDAVFETVSGITTTGATVITGLDHAPPGILLWRSLLQWLGGVGIIVLATAILPILSIGGMQLYRLESSEKSEKTFPRVTQIASAIGTIYLVLTLLCILSYWIAGMSGFDAICHAMATVSTGGFSSHDLSVGFFADLDIEIVAIIFMVSGSLPFMTYYHFFNGKPELLWRDRQIRWFIVILAGSAVILAGWLVATDQYETPAEAFRHALFNMTSVLTTTGYASVDYSAWGSFALTFIFMLSVMGGCTGSTTGGIKIFRYQVLYQSARSQLRQLLQPHGVFIPKFQGKPISEKVVNAVMGFFVLFAFCFLVLVILLSAFGLDYLSAMSVAASSLANVGPALGPEFGPAGNFSSLPDGAKWLLCVAMTAGRLELFTILVLFTPRFWQQ